jgi:maltokinase
MIDLTELRAVLEERLPEHLARQRWSGAGDRPITSVSLRWAEEVCGDDPLLVWVLADTTFDDGGRQTFQLFLAVRSLDPPVDFLHGKEREHVALVPHPDGDVVVYDALVDPELAVEVLHLVAPEVEVTTPRPIVLEHSNSSLVFDERYILKVLRKIEPGPNPDVEIPRILADRDCPHVQAPLAELRRDDMDLAVLREFLVGATEGWVLALASVKDMLASRLAPEESGGDFVWHAERLGGVLGELHLAMADAWGRQDGSGDRWADAMLEHLAEVPGLDRALAGAQLDRAGVEAVYRRLAGLDDPGAEIRIHGDLHLAQVLLVDAGWIVLDFEGEPARRRSDRFTDSSPLRDIAGLLRSLHYAVSVGLQEWGDPDEEQIALADAWEQRNRRAIVDAYLAVDGVAALLPREAAARTAVLEAFELDKAIYEVAYELGHRPDQVGIPLAGVRRLLGAGSRS